MSHTHALNFNLTRVNFIDWPHYHHPSNSNHLWGNKYQTDPLQHWKGPPLVPFLSLPALLIPLYRGGVKAPWAALAAAWRTAWLDMTPVANSAWAFWKLASVCLYKLWIWNGEEQNMLTPDTSSNSSSYHVHCEGENDTQNLISWLFSGPFVIHWLLHGRWTTCCDFLLGASRKPN